MYHHDAIPDFTVRGKLRSKQLNNTVRLGSRSNQCHRSAGPAWPRTRTVASTSLVALLQAEDWGGGVWVQGGARSWRHVKRLAACTVPPGGGGGGGAFGGTGKGPLPSCAVDLLLRCLLPLRLGAAAVAAFAGPAGRLQQVIRRQGQQWDDIGLAERRAPITPMILVCISAHSSSGLPRPISIAQAVQLQQEPEQNGFGKG